MPLTMRSGFRVLNSSRIFWSHFGRELVFNVFMFWTRSLESYLLFFFMTLCRGSINVSLLKNQLLFYFSRHHPRSQSEGTVQSWKGAIPIHPALSRPPCIGDLSSPPQQAVVGVDILRGWSKLLTPHWILLMFSPVLLMRRSKLRVLYIAQGQSGRACLGLFSSKCHIFSVDSRWQNPVLS